MAIARTETRARARGVRINDARPASPTPFTHSDVDHLGLAVYTFRAYAALVCRAAAGLAYETVGHMAADSRMSTTRFRMALRELERRKLISTEFRVGDASVYHVHGPSSRSSR